MASAFGHALAGWTLERLTHPYDRTRRLWILAVICAILPDIDVVGRHFGISPDGIWGHRGFTHSLLFAALVALFVGLVFLEIGPVPQEKKLSFSFFSSRLLTEY